MIRSIKFLTSAMIAPLAILASSLGLLACTPTYHDVSAFDIRPRPVAIPVPYTVGVGDAFDVLSENVEEIKGRYSVAPDGTITVRLIGRLYVAGLNAAQLESLLRQRVIKFYQEVDVMVRITSFTSKAYYVFGEVSVTGRKEWTGQETILDVLATSNPNAFAETTRIYIMRPSPDGRSVRSMTVDFESMKTQGKLHRNVLVAPGDIIYIPPTGFILTARLIEYVLLPLAPISQLVQAPLSIYGLGGGYNQEFSGGLARTYESVDTGDDN